MNPKSNVLDSALVSQELKAHVEGGRYVIDSPASHPEGCELRLVLLDDDQLDSEGRGELHVALEEAAEEIERGEVVSEEAIWAGLRKLR